MLNVVVNVTFNWAQKTEKKYSLIIIYFWYWVNGKIFKYETWDQKTFKYIKSLTKCYYDERSSQQDSRLNKKNKRNSYTQPLQHAFSTQKWNLWNKLIQTWV